MLSRIIMTLGVPKLACGCINCCSLIVIFQRKSELFSWQKWYRPRRYACLL